MAKQNPIHTMQYSDSTRLPIYYAGSNGAFFGPRAGGLGLAYVGKHAFAGLAGPAVVESSSVQVQTGALRVTASGAVRVAVVGITHLSFDQCAPLNGTEVEVKWNLSSAQNGYQAQPLAEFIGGAMGLRFEVPHASVLYAFHV
eukprot:SAG31_NODE_1198_length_9441_cov_3.648897_3_plen_143_part_00